MKKNLVLALCAATVIGASAQAIDIKKPDLGALKNVAGTTTANSENKAKEEAQQKAFQAAIDTANSKLATAKSLANTSIWTLGELILDEETYKGFASKKSDAATADEVLKALNTKLAAELKIKDFNSTDIVEIATPNNTKYVNAVKNLQIASNRYENIMNNMSPSFKKVLDGDYSMLAVKSQLAESAKLTKNVKSVSMGQNSLLNKLNKVNEKAKVSIVIPDSEKVVYNKDGVVGSINYQLDSINGEVNKAYDDIINAFHLQEDVKSLKAKMLEQDKDAMGKVSSDKAAGESYDELAKQQAIVAKLNDKNAISNLDAKQKTAIVNAGAKLLASGVNYTALGLQCTKLGMAISAKPIIAAPLALEVGQLKYTAKVLKNSATSVKKVSGPMVKVAKASGVYEDMKNMMKDTVKATLKSSAESKANSKVNGLTSGLTSKLKK